MKVFVDTAPVMEKPLAQAAGLGWQGKHTNLVSREFGSWLFLGSIFTTLELRRRTTPKRIIAAAASAVSTSARPTPFPRPIRIDARRCISYLTIEHKGHIAREFRKAIGNRIYGCDDCLAVCPWNKFAQFARETAFPPRVNWRRRCCANSRARRCRFRDIFRGSPIKRIGRDRFVRNVLIAIGNSGDAPRPAAQARLADASPLVRAMAVWALSSFSSPAEFAVLAEQHTDSEVDPDVRSEWKSALHDRS